MVVLKCSLLFLSKKPVYDETDTHLHKSEIYGERKYIHISLVMLESILLMSLVDLSQLI